MQQCVLRVLPSGSMMTACCACVRVQLLLGAGCAIICCMLPITGTVITSASPSVSVPDRLAAPGHSLVCFSSDDGVQASQLKLVKYLYRACVDSDPERFSVLPDMRSSKRFHVTPYEARAPFLVACEKGDMELVSYFVAQGAELDLAQFTARLVCAC